MSAAMSMKWSIEGLVGLKAKLDRLAKTDARAVIRKGNRAGAKIITAAVKALAPVGETGRLKASIKTRAMKRSRRWIGSSTTLGKGFFKGETFYGAFVEFGHRVGPRRLGSARKEVPGQHFMLRAVRAAGKSAVDTAAETMAKELCAIAAR